jgi:hypothetical protein
MSSSYLIIERGSMRERERERVLEAQSTATKARPTNYL